MEVGFSPSSDSSSFGGDRGNPERTNGPEAGGVLLSKFDRRTVLSDQILQVLRDDLGERLLRTAIRVNVDLVKAQIAQKSIFEYSPRSAGTEDFLALTEEILNG